MPITWARSSMLWLRTRIWVSVPTITNSPRSTKAKVVNRPSNRVTCSTRARLTMLADTSMRNVVIRVRTSFWAMVRVESRLQCSVASS